MARFEVERHCKQPNWALMLMATFPFDRTKSYPDIERYAMMGSVLDHIMGFTYKCRNTMQSLALTHDVCCKEDSITIKTPSGKPVLTIRITTDN